MGFADWLQRLFHAPSGTPSLPEPALPRQELPPPPAPAVPPLPDGWVLTDDMTVPLPPGRTVAEVVDFVIQAALVGVPDDETERRLVAEFGLSDEDAFIARDRTFGGLFRARSGNPDNRPSPVKDPVAWESYQRGTRDPSLAARIYP